LTDQISLTSNLTVLPRFLRASSWYSFCTKTMTFSPIFENLPVNFIIINHLSILSYIRHIKYTIVLLSILYIIVYRSIPMITTTQQMGDGLTSTEIRQQVEGLDCDLQTKIAILGSQGVLAEVVEYHHSKQIKRQQKELRDYWNGSALECTIRRVQRGFN